MSDRIDISAERAKLAALEGHTPGPWESKAAKDGSGDIGIITDGGCLAECFHEIRRRDEGAYSEQAANARLIAAAPDLLTTDHRLLDELKRERAENERLRVMLARNLALDVGSAEAGIEMLGGWDAMCALIAHHRAALNGEGEA